MKTGNRELVHWLIGGAVVLLLYELLLKGNGATATPGPYALPGGPAGASDLPFSGPSPPLVGPGQTVLNSGPGGTTITSNVYGYPNPGFPPPTSMYQLFQAPTINQTFWGPGGNPSYYPLFGFVGVDSTQSFQ